MHPYDVALGEKTAIPATGVLQRTLMEWMALWIPLHWVKGYPTRPESSKEEAGPSHPNLNRIRLHCELFSAASVKEVREPRSPHPIFGPMKPYEWWRWGYLHADHHLRQFGR